MEAVSGYGDNWDEKEFKEIVEVLESVRNGVHWENGKAEMRKYLAEELDREIKDVYMSDEDESKRVWAAMHAAVAE